MKTIYRAFDGKEFEYEWECEEYEKKQSIASWSDKITAFDINKNKISPDEFEKTYYISIADKKTYAEYAKMSENVRVDPPEGPGEWYFSDGDGWISFSDRITVLKEEIEELEDVRNQMRGE